MAKYRAVFPPVILTREQYQNMHDTTTHGACITMDAKIFDSYEGENARRALEACRSCAVTSQCFDWVRPHFSYYTGVCAGIAWHEGRKY